MRLEKIIDYPLAKDGYSLVASSVANDESLLFLFATESLQSARLVRVTTASQEITDLPAIDYALKCSHLFNLLDASGSVGVTERTAYIHRVRQLAVAIAAAWLKTQSPDGVRHGS